MSDTLSVSIRGGASLEVPADIRALTTFVLLEQEDWFEPELAFVCRFLEPGMVVSDVGASYGVYAVPMAHCVGSGGAVWAFEPTPEVANLLERNLQAVAGGNGRVLRVALSDRTGEGRLARGRFDEINRLLPTPGASRDGLAVSVATLDSQLQLLGAVRPAFVKIDVEGLGGEVIHGGEQTFRDGEPLVMFEIRDGSGSVDRAGARRLLAAGYALYRLAPGPGVLLPFDIDGPADPFLLNLFAAKPATRATLRERGLLVEADTGAKAGEGSWRAWAAPLPYASHAVKRWPGGPGWFGGAARKALHAALDAFAASRSLPGRTAWSHIDALLDARDHALAAANGVESPGALMTLARIEHELGNRGFAVQALQRVDKLAGSARLQVPELPFLPPIARYDRIAWDGRDARWIDAAVFESLIKLEAFSSYYEYRDRLAALERIAPLPFVSPEMERRRQLLRIRKKIQSGFEATAPVASAGPENLNPGLWHAATALRP